MYYMFLADGFEETEALVTLDMLRRAGICIKTVGVGSDMPEGTHRIKVYSDISDADFAIDDCDGIVLPGGMPGTENLFASDVVLDAVGYCRKNSKLTAAICAAPIILGRMGYLDGKNAVCYPGFENELSGAKISAESCVTDGDVITAKGAGCVFEFSHQIISYIVNKETADKIIAEIQHKGLN